MPRMLQIAFFVLMLTMSAIPTYAESIQDAAKQVEAAIQSAMSHSGTGSGPTLGQLGGVQAGATGSDAGAGAGGDGSSGGGAGGGSGGSGSGGGCFAPETLVLMSDGTSKPIADIKVGDKVASWDFAKNAMVTVAVEYIYSVQRDFHFFVDGIRVTAEHPFCTAPGQYMEVQFLKKGTLVASVTDGGVKFVPVVEFAKINEAGTFHNMTVSDTHTYIVSPTSRERERETAGPQQGQRLIVHNKGGSGGF